MSVQEDLKTRPSQSLKQVPIDQWSTWEKLALATSVQKSGDQNWSSVSRPLKAFAEKDRPTDWFGQKFCALQYNDLLEKIEFPKRKRGERGEETAQDIIVKKLTAQVTEELENELRQGIAQFCESRKRLDIFRSKDYDATTFRKMCQDVYDKQQAKQKEKREHEEWLAERQDKIARMNRRVPIHAKAKQSAEAIDKKTPEVVASQTIEPKVENKSNETIDASNDQPQEDSFAKKKDKPIRSPTKLLSPKRSSSPIKSPAVAGLEVKDEVMDESVSFSVATHNEPNNQVVLAEKEKEIQIDDQDGGRVGQVSEATETQVKPEEEMNQVVCLQSGDVQSGAIDEKTSAMKEEIEIEIVASEEASSLDRAGRKHRRRSNVVPAPAGNASSGGKVRTTRSSTARPSDHQQQSDLSVASPQPSIGSGSKFEIKTDGGDSGKSRSNSIDDLAAASNVGGLSTATPPASVTTVADSGQDDESNDAPSTTTEASDDGVEFQKFRKFALKLINDLQMDYDKNLIAPPPADTPEAEIYEHHVYFKMDMATMLKRIKTGVVRCNAELKRDLMIMFANLIMLNPAMDGATKNKIADLKKFVLDRIEPHSKGKRDRSSKLVENKPSPSGRRKTRGSTSAEPSTLDASGTPASSKKSSKRSKV